MTAAPAAAPTGRFGIRAKLILALGAVAAMTVVASAVGWVTYNTVDQRLVAITRTNLPAMDGAQRLAQESAAIAAAAPALDAAQDQQTRREMQEAMARRSERLLALIDELEAARGDGTAVAMRDLAQRMAGNLEALDRIVGQRLELRGGRDSRILALAEVHESLLARLQPRIGLAGENLVAQGDNLANFTTDSVHSLTGEAVGRLLTGMQFRADIAGLAAAVARAAEAATPPAVELQAAAFADIAVRFSDSFAIHAAIPGTDHRAASLIRQLLAAGTGPEGIFALRRQAFAADSEATRQALLDRIEAIGDTAIRLGAELDAILEPVIADMRERIKRSGDELQNDIQSSVQDLLADGMMEYRTYLELAATGNLIAGLLTDAANTSRADRLPQLRSRFSAAEKVSGANLAMLPDDDDAMAIRSLAEELAGFGRGSSSLFDLRAGELEADAKAAELLAQNRDLAHRLGEMVDALVAESRSGTDAAAIQAEGAIESGRFWLVVISVVSIVGAGLIVWLYVGRRIAARLQRLSEAMRRIATGDLAAPIPEGGADEIGDMVRALTVFRDTAREVAAANERTEAERRRAAEERRQAMLDMADSFETNVSAVVERVSASAEEVHAAADEMAATAEHSSREANAAAVAADQATAGVTAAASAVEQLSGSISEISRQVHESARIARSAAADAERTDSTVRGLSDAAQKIGEVVQLIGEIASQTNLLALNATIEAARAGDAGKGFAVVASEVKNLANQTSRATEDIAVQIGAMQSATRDAVEAVRGIARTISDIDGIAATIAAAVEQQGAATQEIARNVHGVASDAGQAGMSIGTVSQAAAVTGRSAEQVLSAAGDLARQAEILRAQVDHFLNEVRSA